MKPGREKLILDSIFYQEVQLRPFLLMRNSKLSKKKPKRKHVAVAERSHPKDVNFANKVVE